MFRDSTPIRNLQESTSGRIFKDDSFDEEDKHVCLKVFDKEDDYEVTESYK